MEQRISILLSLFLLYGCTQPRSSSSFVLIHPDPFDIPAQFAQQESGDESATLLTVSESRYGRIVRRYSEQYGVDWALVLAVMNEESRFRHDAVSFRGAYGLMQIMPITQIELTEKLGVDEAISPKNNIKAGVFHLRRLYGTFSGSAYEDRLRLTLAAYNAGLGRVQDAQRIAAHLGNNPHDWVSVRDALQFLNKQSYTLHRQIWRDGHPQNGYFRDWKKTVKYVDNVLDQYEGYLALR